MTDDCAKDVAATIIIACIWLVTIATVIDGWRPDGRMPDEAGMLVYFALLATCGYFGYLAGGRLR